MSILMQIFYIFALGNIANYLINAVIMKNLNLSFVQLHYLIELLGERYSLVDTKIKRLRALDVSVSFEELETIESILKLCF